MAWPGSYNWNNFGSGVDHAPPPPRDFGPFANPEFWQRCFEERDGWEEWQPEPPRGPHGHPHGHGHGRRGGRRHSGRPGHGPGGEGHPDATDGEDFPPEYIDAEEVAAAVADGEKEQENEKDSDGANTPDTTTSDPPEGMKAVHREATDPEDHSAVEVVAAVVAAVASVLAAVEESTIDMALGHAVSATIVLHHHLPSLRASSVALAVAQVVQVAPTAVPMVLLMVLRRHRHSSRRSSELDLDLAARVVRMDVIPMALPMALHHPRRSSKDSLEAVQAVQVPAVAPEVLEVPTTYLERAQNPSREGAGDKSGDEKENESSFTPPLDLFEQTDRWVLHIAVPGAKKEDVGVSWDADRSVLSVSGVVHRPGDEEFLKGLKSGERSTGLFSRDVKLPPAEGEKKESSKEEVNVEAIEAKMEDGILIVTVPKIEKGWTEVKKVDIQ
ncbi:hypothetical protein VPNG_00364 [Cytospora leucostoma]|uniref:SHSP domain-containing protein n=1 Tax=Cytospora leucostoma TaxID=1230097 RepID=A0A423XNV5_9PEZI|nr:hypothetical protein VPNG_00364 [Cytospora leucostoma]